MTISIELTPEQAERLRDRAESQGLQPEEFATAAIQNLIAQPDEEFLRIAEYIVEKNAELYRRLSQ
jgi:antitoxin FitA